MVTIITTAEDYYVADNLNQLASLVENNDILDEVYEGNKQSVKVEEVGINTTICRKVTPQIVAEMLNGMTAEEKDEVLRLSGIYFEK